ncbi:MAG: hypothetical protein KZQ92_20580, partial [Candidatus Thiodiazotropha sp. (ex Lucinoma borealis)]|nr:hypothetical protein [Candidatus Thiodiazotropha sp. (ex Lucinoma borealis)]MCU7866360.1 hypothetical protein [Candidatus Thiodiazotropha sp. (ex Lucinoma borealis)]
GVPQGHFLRGATRRAKAIFSPSGVISRLCRRATLRFFCLAGQKNGLGSDYQISVNRPYQLLT